MPDLRKKKKKRQTISSWHDCCDKLNCRNKNVSLYKLNSVLLDNCVGRWAGAGGEGGSKHPKKSIFLYSSLQQLLWEVLWNSNLPLHIPNDATAPIPLLSETWSWNVLQSIGAPGLNNKATEFSYTVLSDQATVHPRLGRTRHFTEDHTQITPSSLDPCSLCLSLPHWSPSLS